MTIRMLALFSLGLLGAGVRAAEPGLAWPPAAAAAATDLGALRAGEIRRGELSVLNRRVEALTVLDVRSSCDCLQVLERPELVPAGGVGRVAFRYVGVQAGAGEVQLTVRTDDPVAPEQVWRLRVKTAPATAGTQVPDLAAIAPENFVRSAWRPDPAALLAPAAVRAIAARTDVVFVDAREADDFLRGRLAGAINAPVRSIRTKPYLRAQTLVLTDDGADSARLLAAREELRRENFGEVFVLDGGLNAWLRTGGASEGFADDPSARRWTITPAALHASLTAGVPWARVGAETDPRAEYLLPHAAGWTDGALRRVADAAAKPDAAPARVLVVSRDGSGGDVAVERLRDAPSAVFHLEGGLDAYEAFLRRRTAERRASAPTVLTVRSDAPAPLPGMAVPRAATLRPTGCATCPGAR